MIQGKSRILEKDGQETIMEKQVRDRGKGSGTKERTITYDSSSTGEDQTIDKEDRIVKRVENRIAEKIKKYTRKIKELTDEKLERQEKKILKILEEKVEGINKKTDELIVKVEQCINLINHLIRNMIETSSEGKEL